MDASCGLDSRTCSRISGASLHPFRIGHIFTGGGILRCQPEKRAYQMLRSLIVARCSTSGHKHMHAILQRVEKDSPKAFFGSTMLNHSTTQVIGKAPRHTEWKNTCTRLFSTGLIERDGEGRMPPTNFKPRSLPWKRHSYTIGLIPCLNPAYFMDV